MSLSSRAPGTAAPLKADSGKPVVFSSPELHPDRNRVYYAGSLKQARGWAKYTSIPYNLCPNNCEYDFRKYGVFVIFYKGQVDRIEGGFDPRIDDIEESAAGELSAKVTAACYAPACKEAQADPSDPSMGYVHPRADCQEIAARAAEDGPGYDRVAVI